MMYTHSMPKVGAHVSAAISLELSFQRAQDIGAQAAQIFISPPQMWQQPKHDQAEIDRYLEKSKHTGIGPNFIHGTYLINLGTQDEAHLKRSTEWLVIALNMAEKMGIEGLIFHTGSHKGNGFDSVLSQVAKSIKDVLKQVPGKVKLILETSAGAGGGIGGKFEELGQILKAVDNSRLKVCIDTQHVFAAGYDIKTKGGLDTTLKTFDKIIGLTNLLVIHANDSKTELSSGSDRHENIGEGFIGKDGFTNLINHPKLEEIPFILEVPGFSGNGPDKENIDLLKSLRN